MEEVKEHQNKWRDTSYSWIKRLNNDKILLFPNLMYRFNVMPINFSGSYFVDNNKHILNVYGGQKLIRNSLLLP